MNETEMIRSACDLIQAMLDIMKRKGKFNSTEYELAEQCKKNLKVAGTGAMKSIPYPLCDQVKATLISKHIPFASFETAGGLLFIVDGKDETVRDFSEVLETACKSSTQGYKNLPFSELANEAYKAGYSNFVTMNFGHDEVNGLNQSKFMREVAAQKMYQCGVVCSKRKNPETGDYELMPHPGSIYNRKGEDLAFAEMMIAAEFAKESKAFDSILEGDKDKENLGADNLNNKKNKNLLLTRLKQAEYDEKALDAVCEAYNMEGVNVVLCDRKKEGAQEPYIEIQHGEKGGGKITVRTIVNSEKHKEEIPIPAGATDAEIKALLSKYTEQINNMSMAHEDDFRRGDKASIKFYPSEERKVTPKEASDTQTKINKVLELVNRDATAMVKKTYGEINPLDKKSMYDAYLLKQKCIKRILEDDGNERSKAIDEIFNSDTQYRKDLVDCLDGCLDGEIGKSEGRNATSKIHVDYNWEKLSKKKVKDIEASYDRGKVAEDRSAGKEREL